MAIFNSHVKLPEDPDADQPCQDDFALVLMEDNEGETLFDRRAPQGPSLPGAKQLFLGSATKNAIKCHNMPYRAIPDMVNNGKHTKSELENMGDNNRWFPYINLGDLAKFFLD
jgi:hypothetical protein